MSFAQFSNFLSSHFLLRDQKPVSPLNVGILEITSDFVIRKAPDSVLPSLLGESDLQGKNFVHLIKHRVSPGDYKKLLPALNDVVMKKDVIASSQHRTPLDCLKVHLAGKDGRAVVKYIRIEFRKTESFSSTGYWHVVVKDISKVVRLSKKIRRTTAKAELKVSTMMSLLQFERDLIREFIDSTAYSLKDVVKNISKSAADDREVKQSIENVFCIVHQIKGDSAILRLTSISDGAHQFEEVLSKLNQRRNLSQKDLRLLIRPLRMMIDSVKEVKRLFDSIVEGGWNQNEAVGDDSMKRRLQYLIKRISEDNSKRVLVVDDGYCDLAIPQHLRKVIATVVTQLARNAVIHGIEDIPSRLGKNKTPYGCFHVSVARTSDRLLITTRDDGRGIDESLVKKTAIRSPLFDRKQVANWTKKQVFQALFKPGFSTAKIVTLHAGRGVGLDVIKSTVEKYGGRIGIRSVLGEFTEFSLSFPVGGVLTPVR